jgi:AcrR family transcriptional regulator
MKDICSEARLSPGAVYLHFSSKEDIIEASWQSIWERRAVQMEEVMQNDFTPQTRGRLLDAYESRLVYADTDRAWIIWVQLLAEALHSPRIKESICRNWDDGEKHTVKLLQHGAERGVIAADIEFDVVARLWQAVHDGLVIMKIIDPEKDVQKYLEVYKKAFRILLFNNNKKSSNKVGKRRSDDGGEAGKK